MNQSDASISDLYIHAGYSNKANMLMNAFFEHEGGFFLLMSKIDIHKIIRGDACCVRKKRKTNFF